MPIALLLASELILGCSLEGEPTPLPTPPTLIGTLIESLQFVWAALRALYESEAGARLVQARVFRRHMADADYGQLNSRDDSARAERGV